MKRDFSLSVQYLHKAQEKMRVQSDKKRREVVFRTGEQVLLLMEHLNLKNAPVHKLKRQFVGPFFVVHQVGPVAYELDLPDTWKIHKIFPHQLTPTLQDKLLVATLGVKSD